MLELECLHLNVNQVFAVGVARVLTIDTEKVFILCNNSWEKNTSELKSADDWHWKSVFYATTAEIRTSWSNNKVFFVTTAEKEHVFVHSEKFFFICNNSWERTCFSRKSASTFEQWKVFFYVRKAEKRSYWSLKSTYACQWKLFFVLTTAEKGHVLVGRVSTSSQCDVFLCNNSRKKDIMELEECLHSWEWKKIFMWQQLRIYWVGRVLILDSENVFLMYCNKLTTAGNRTC
jgi:hypothetical protein